MHNYSDNTFTFNKITDFSLADIYEITIKMTVEYRTDASEDLLMAKMEEEVKITFNVCAASGLYTENVFPDPLIYTLVDAG